MSIWYIQQYTCGWTDSRGALEEKEGRKDLTRLPVRKPAIHTISQPSQPHLLQTRNTATMSDKIHILGEEVGDKDK